MLSIIRVLRLWQKKLVLFLAAFVILVSSCAMLVVARPKYASAQQSLRWIDHATLQYGSSYFRDINPRDADREFVSTNPNRDEGCLSKIKVSPGGSVAEKVTIIIKRSQPGNACPDKETVSGFSNIYENVPISNWENTQFIYGYRLSSQEIKMYDSSSDKLNLHSYKKGDTGPPNRYYRVDSSGGLAQFPYLDVLDNGRELNLINNASGQDGGDNQIPMLSRVYRNNLAVKLRLAPNGASPPPVSADGNFTGGEDGGGSDDSDGGGGDSDSAEDNLDSNCQVSGNPLSWILCPILNLVEEAFRAGLSIMENMLSYDFRTGENGENSAIQEAWSRFRTIANVLFVIAFMVMILSQLVVGRW